MSVLITHAVRNTARLLIVVIAVSQLTAPGVAGTYANSCSHHCSTSAR